MEFVGQSRRHDAAHPSDTSEEHFALDSLAANEGQNEHILVLFRRRSYDTSCNMLRSLVAGKKTTRHPALQAKSLDKSRCHVSRPIGLGVWFSDAEDLEFFQYCVDGNMSHGCTIIIDVVDC